MADESIIFEPYKIGDMILSSRIIMAPLTRFRADKEHAHTDLAVKYYSQRACYPGTLLTTEATFITARAGIDKNIPGVWSEKQLAAWKKITDAVHSRGSYIILQMWALGRAANEEDLEANRLPFVSASDIPLTTSKSKPRPLTKQEIKEYVQDYATAAENCVSKGGFDGVEIHCANGYLLDQFLQDVSNNRTDEYGGSIENRCRFPLEVVDAVIKRIGEKKVGLRISPWGRFQDMRMEDLVPTFSYFLTCLRDLYPSLAYISLVEPRVHGNYDIDVEDVPEGDTNDIFRKIWGDRPIVVAGKFESAQDIAKAVRKGGVVAIGRYFISNPDFIYRIKNNIPLTPYDRNTFYLHESPVGYIDYPVADGSQALIIDLSFKNSFHSTCALDLS